jgi:hypothetical protein
MMVIIEAEVINIPALTLYLHFEAGDPIDLPVVLAGGMVEDRAERPGQDCGAIME